MRTLIVGAGRAGKAVLDLAASGELAELRLQIAAVAEIRAEAPGLAVAHRQGWPVFTDALAALALPGLELIIELTGDDRVLAQIHHVVGPGVRVMDHATARIFWDLHSATQRLQEQLAKERCLQRRTDRAARRFTQLLAASQSIITIKSREGRYQEANPGATTLLGCERHELLGKVARDLLAAPAAQTIEAHDEDAWRARHPVCHREELVLRGETRVLRAERFLIDSDEEVTDCGGEDGGPALCCVAQDVTEQMRVQQDLVLTEKQAAVGRLAAGVAHEINNPLTGILTFAESLQEDLAGNPAVEDDLAVIVHETLRCRQIVRTLLDFARPASSVRRPTRIAAVIRKAVELVAKQASFHDIHLRVSVEDDDLLVHADANELQQVFLNLIVNARDASDGKGEVRVRAALASGGQSVFVAVEDDGCGMADELQTRIFEPFFSTKADRGHGLGLAVIRNIVEQHGGSIVVDSRKGVGSTFRILLPAASPAAAPSPTTRSAGDIQ